MNLTKGIISSMEISTIGDNETLTHVQLHRSPFNSEQFKITLVFPYEQAESLEWFQQIAKESEGNWSFPKLNVTFEVMPDAEPAH
jgi:hypothetical protein